MWLHTVRSKNGCKDCTGCIISPTTRINKSVPKPDSHQRSKHCKLSLLASVNDKTLFAAKKTPAMSNKNWTWSTFQHFSLRLNYYVLVASMNLAIGKIVIDRELHHIDNAPHSGWLKVWTVEKKSEVCTLVEETPHVLIQTLSRWVHMNTMSVHRTLKELNAHPFQVIIQPRVETSQSSSAFSVLWLDVTLHTQ